MFRHTLILLSATVVLVACSDGIPTSLAVIDGPSFALSDGSNGGTAGFFFLPPIVDQPNATGDFNPNLPPRVEICELVGDDMTDCVAGPPLRSFAPSEIVVAPGEQYRVGWQTGQDNLSFNKLYRIFVFIGTVELGFRDVDPVETAQEVPKAQVPGIYVFKNGSNIPIKFRIETNVLCDVAVCTVGSATTADGGTIVIESGGVASGGVEISGGSFTTPDGVVAVIVERLPNANCLGGTGTGLPGLDIPQFGDCFRIRTEPELTGPLTEPALVALCFDFDLNTDLSADQIDLLRIHRFNEHPSTPVVEALPNALSKVCGETRGTFLSTNPVMRFAWKAVRGVLGLPKPLQAADLGLGGLISSFSRFRWALPSKFEQPLLAGDGQTALVNTAVAVPPAVKVVDDNGDPVKGATVHFKVALGGGTVVPADPIVVTTGSDGIADVTSWTMGTAVGLNTLDAFGFGISAGSTPFYDAANLVAATLETGTVTFTATACDVPNVLDGEMLAGEWDCAAQEDFPVNLSGGSTTTGTLFWVNDADNLYLAVRVPRDAEDRVNSLRFDFDNDNDGLAEAGDDAIEFDGASDLFTDEFLTRKCSNRGQSGCGALDTSDGGTSDGAGGFSNDGTFSVYELSHPFNSADDAHDISVVAPGQASFFLTLRTGKGAQGNTQWPGFRIFKTITISDGS